MAGARPASVLDTRVHELEEQLRTLARERDILKKTLSIFIQKGWWTYYLANGRLVGKGFAVWMVCETLQVGRSGYYACQRGMVGEGERTDRRLMAQVRSIFLEHKRRYGTRRNFKEPED